MQTFGSLTLQPALERPELLGDPVREALASWEHAGTWELRRSTRTSPTPPR